MNDPIQALQILDGAVANCDAKRRDHIMYQEAVECVRNALAERKRMMEPTPEKETPENGD